jgi:hypothetical protein
MQTKTIILWLHKSVSVEKWSPTSESSYVRTTQIMDMLIKSFEKSGGSDPRKDYRKIEVAVKEIEI